MISGHQPLALRSHQRRCRQPLRLDLNPKRAPGMLQAGINGGVLGKFWIEIPQDADANDHAMLPMDMTQVSLIRVFVRYEVSSGRVIG